MDTLYSQCEWCFQRKVSVFYACQHKIPLRKMKWLLKLAHTHIHEHTEAERANGRINIHVVFVQTLERVIIIFPNWISYFFSSLFRPLPLCVAWPKFVWNLVSMKFKSVVNPEILHQLWQFAIKFRKWPKFCEQCPNICFNRNFPRFSLHTFVGNIFGPHYS